jgi:hypothetical protein
MQRQAMNQNQIKATGECKTFVINERDGRSESSVDDSRLKFQWEGSFYQRYETIFTCKKGLDLGLLHTRVNIQNFKQIVLK